MFYKFKREMCNFTCIKCNLTFKSKSSLKRHDISKHSNKKTVFECPDCGRCFNRTDTLKRHSVVHLPETPIFECAFCAKKFSRKNNLSTHISILHLLTNPSAFQCAHCSKTLRYKRDLIDHIFVSHWSELNLPSAPTFKCSICSRAFKKKKILVRHIRTHDRVQRKECRIKCLICSKVFRYTDELNEHYVQVHEVVLTYENLEFDSVDSYRQWLEDQQRETVTQFITWYRKKFAAHSIERRICHRSRDFYRKLKEDNRKRCLKANGYKKLGGICPAEIKVHIRDNGACSVKYQKTHVGHKVGDKSELGLIFITETEKNKIAAKIASGIPLAEIVDQERLSGSCKEKLSRLGILKSKDVRNIASSRGLQFQSRALNLPGRDPVDVDAKIAAHSDDILFYKPQSEDDLRFNVFQKDDFVLVIMTANQETYLRTYGHKVVCLDSIQGTNPHGFTLHTLFVLDAECEGLPAAFLLTNRNDQDAVDIFLTCIRERTGTVETRTLMSDMQMTYFNSWAKIMNAPQNFIFCSWCVEEAWRKNYSKIADPKKRGEVQKELKRLLHELDTSQFETGLNAFLSRDDDDLNVFREYFRVNYESNVSRWAYCHQMAVGVNTDMHLKSFRKIYKHLVAGGRKLTSLTHCLEFIFGFMNLLETNICEKKIRGKATRKLSTLRYRHRAAFEQYTKDTFARVLSADNNAFSVQSSTRADTFYTVSAYESRDCIGRNEPCELCCDLCNLCIHSFKCTCADSSVASNMCKHIHLVGLHLQYERSSSCLSTETTTLEEKKFNVFDGENHIDDDGVAIYHKEIDDAIDILRNLKSVNNKHLMNYITEKFLEPLSLISSFTQPPYNT